MRIAILPYDRFTALDAVGPYEVLSRIPGAEVVFTAARPGAAAASGSGIGLRDRPVGIGGFGYLGSADRRRS